MLYDIEEIFKSIFLFGMTKSTSYNHSQQNLLLHSTYEEEEEEEIAPTNIIDIWQSLKKKKKTNLLI